MHRGEANPRTRSGVMALEILDTTPDWNRHRACFENASRKVLRLRQKVVMPTLPTAPARWVVDPDFNLDFHLRAGFGFPEPGPFARCSISRRSSCSHRSTSRGPCGRPRWWKAWKGQGGIAAASQSRGDGRRQPSRCSRKSTIWNAIRRPASSPMPVPQDLSPNDLMRQGINQLPGKIVGGVVSAVAARSRRSEGRSPIRAQPYGMPWTTPGPVVGS